MRRGLCVAALLTICLSATASRADTSSFCWMDWLYSYGQGYAFFHVGPGPYTAIFDTFLGPTITFGDYCEDANGCDIEEVVPAGPRYSSHRIEGAEPVYHYVCGYR